MAGEREYSAAYRRRIERSLGMSIEAARERGISFQKARGHVPREKALLEARRRERGDFTDPERAFLKRQLAKEARWRPSHEQSERAAHATAVFRGMSPDQRAQVMAAQRRLAGGYRSHKRAARAGRAAAGRAGAARGGMGGGGMGGGA